MTVFSTSKWLLSYLQYRCDIMSPLFLGYLYFYITVNSMESLGNVIPTSNWENFTESTEYFVKLNCTQCNVIAEQLCNCSLENYGRYSICCSDSQCCYCENCVLYQRRQDLLVIIEISVSVLCAFGILGLLVIYCKLCKRTRQNICRRPRCIVFRDEYNTITHCSTIEGLRERPPPYSEVAHSTSVHTSSNNAPPLYTSPYNRTSMQEAPPSYPGTPKPQERTQLFDQPSTVSVTQHM
ncbi:uncharacterized protein LOC109858842 [Pseudomyrmex gracilis]|uniref:uncharacterized protein LOC109858842 n=1 Tax=Pseudomyrmex gracilis TaxID=219809 RepID=UPI000995D53E|nr:uncharacterized protein LOC109858842 [Pseudomyrmex gracilis]